jgi:hypothetical protein
MVSQLYTFLISTLILLPPTTITYPNIDVSILIRMYLDTKIYPDTFILRQVIVVGGSIIGIFFSKLGVS